ncbi:hypothetical protein VPH46_01830 [Sphingomonas sp. MJ1 (PH-R8)]|uniref:hypothetical protein n=1 Tax=Sphingomonas sp. MJ1 (PH-R8) TaxID=3112950 RepID=UPI003A8782EC
MRELVLNDACLGGALSIGDAATLAEDIERGLADLIAAGHAVSTMRLTSSTGEVLISPGVTLADVLMHLLRHTTGGRLLTRLATKYPVEDDVADDELAALVEWSIPAHPQSLSLLLCARSGRIAVTISDDLNWTIDPLTLVVATDPAKPAATTNVEIDNVFSAASAAALSARLIAAFVATATPAELWRDRLQLFPNVDFAPRVERDLADLGALQYGSAVSRLRELDKASGNWEAEHASPTYLSKVTGESGATMDKYGAYRIFRSATGSDETFELHARLAGGFRLHLREIMASRRIEIGYIGPHLPIVREN